MPTGTIIGSSVKRKEDPRLLKGLGKYVDDIRLLRTNHITFVRSTYAHAKIVSIDIAKAKRHPHVIDVMVGRDITDLIRPFEVKINLPTIKPLKYYPLATDKVRYAGEPIAALLAEDRASAEDAAELVEVSYEPLPVILDPIKAMAEGAPLLYEEWGSNIFVSRKFDAGDIEAAFREADLVIKGRFLHHRHTGVPIETRGCIGSYDQGNQSLLFYSSTQWPHLLRTVLAEALKFPENRIRVIAPDVGGGFGIKNHFFREEVVIALAAIRTRGTIKWTESRSEHMAASCHARDQTHEVEAAVRRDGKILGLRNRAIVDVGDPTLLPYVGVAPALSGTGGLPRGYAIEKYSYELYCVATNKCPSGAYRGFGNPEGVFAMERTIDMIAEALKRDPVEIRLRNLPTEFPYTTASGLRLDSGDYVGTLKKALKLFGYENVRTEQEEGRRNGRLLGIGIAAFAEGSGPSLYVSTGMWTAYESATVKMEPDGRVMLLSGLFSTGTGNETSLAQIVADELGVNFDDVLVVQGDTLLCPYGLGTWGSRGMCTGGAAVTLACRRLREKILTIASRVLDEPMEGLRIEEGKILSIDGLKSMKLQEVAKICYRETFRLPPGLEPGLEATASFDPPIDHFPRQDRKMNNLTTVGNGVHIVYVEVDPETWETKILRYVVVEDCGRIINPMLVEGQIHGGVAQGLGGALYEELLYDDDGRLLTGTLMDYLVPTSMEVPMVEVGHLESPSPLPGGFKGVGESAAIGAPAAIANAVADALKPFRAKITETPLSPERLWSMVTRPDR